MFRNIILIGWGTVLCILVAHGNTSAQSTPAPAAAAPGAYDSRSLAIPDIRGLYIPIFTGFVQGDRGEGSSVARATHPRPVHGPEEPRARPPDRPGAQFPGHQGRSRGVPQEGPGCLRPESRPNQSIYQ